MSERTISQLAAKNWQQNKKCKTLEHTYHYFFHFKTVYCKNEHTWSWTEYDTPNRGGSIQGEKSLCTYKFLMGNYRMVLGFNTICNSGQETLWLSALHDALVFFWYFDSFHNFWQKLIFWHSRLTKNFKKILRKQKTLLLIDPYIQIIIKFSKSIFFFKFQRFCKRVQHWA